MIYWENGCLLTSILLPSLMTVFFLVSSQDGDCSPSSSPVLPPVDCEWKQTGRNKRHCWNSYRMMHTSVDCKWTTPVLRLFSRSLRRSLWSLPLLTKFCLNEHRWVRVRKLIWLSGTHLSVLTALRSLVLPTGLGLSSLSSASISSAMQMHTLSHT